MPRKPFDAAVSDFVQAVGLLVRRMRAAADSGELSWTEAGVLRLIAREGPATTADLARAQGMRPQSMRTIVATLEEMGMVERKPHATDGRQVNIALSAKGTAAQKTVGDAKRTWLARAILQLDDEDRDTLFKAGEIVRRLAEK